MTSIAAYSGVFLIVMSLVALGYQAPEQQPAANAVDTANTLGSSLAANTNKSSDTSVDQLLATNIASSIAERANLPIANNISNLNQSLQVENTLAQTSGGTNAISKPQIVQPTADNRDIQTYVSKVGDTVPAIAAQFGISPNTIKWVNNLNSDAVEPNRTLKILPTDGILYVVKDGDTVDSIVAKYKSNRERFVAFNDLELGGLTPGKEVIVPGGDMPETERPGYVAPRRSGGGYSSGLGGSVNTGMLSASVGNKYAYGNCTWYVYERRAQLGRPVGSFWGNASSWVFSASAAGFGVGSEPQPGAIMQNGGGYGHVAIVESVVPGVSVTISEMNGYRWGGGFNRVATGTLRWDEAVNPYYKYIY